MRSAERMRDTWGIRPFGSARRVFLAAAVGFLVAGDALPATAQGTDSVTVVAGERYGAGRVHRQLLGRDYRELWTVPIRVPVLDLDTFAGGLDPVRTGGNLQTQALRFRAADGREYNFRSVDKELTPALPDYAKGTLVDWIRQDQTSAQLPVSPVVAAALLDAAGVLNPGPRLFVLPDHPRLGEFRAQYAGMPGTLEVHPNEGEDGEPLFAGAERVAGTERVLEHLDEDPAGHRVDARAFLAARLVDVLMGDWDRHDGQWRWARYGPEGRHRWVPVPEDRDYAFVDYDGLLPRVAARTLLPRLITFDASYPSLLALMANSMDLNRRLLSGLERPVWDSVAAALQARLTDEAIHRAVRTMPAPYVERAGTGLASLLKARRDSLRAVAARYYTLLAESVEVHASDTADRADVVRGADGTAEVRVYAGPEGEEPYYRRRFHPGETREIRLFLKGGDDVLRVRGAAGPIVLRVVGGPGDDDLRDASAGPSVLYDAEGENRFVAGPRTRLDTRPHEPPARPEGLLPGSRRDWGASTSLASPSAAWEPHLGPVIGVGPEATRYGFRHHPFRSRRSMRLLYAPARGRIGVEYRERRHPENSAVRMDLLARAGGTAYVRFHGFGNDAPALGERDALYRGEELVLDARWRVPAGRRGWLRAGSRLWAARLAVPGASASPPNGRNERVLLASAVAEAGWDGRDDPVFPRSGLQVEMLGEGSADLRQGAPFGRLRARGAAYVSLPVPGVRPVLALRAGAERVGGAFPFPAAAFLGGSRTLRGYTFQRFAGDGALHGTAELRMPLMPANMVLRGHLGISAFADAGRVFHRGRSPGGWHTATGGAVWFATPLAAVSLNYARGERDVVHLQIGMPF